ncbi:hypothetical protein TVAG_494230 [Trichomonas vaginalis G3]|uniref:VPS9 domain-containing protein n=1 Tax=Trichomonas vaginalis (strain ATCC PRA-98 / G3) TaxID=412133 RepID=A2DQ54_TRIV3|nr:vacuolar sorting protein 9 (VPS9) domain family [Trichomonas vaginalis G3]EAY17481.1 hypothetical protein TVAG_494230 [Trichomonas vaginalis G3]KAI5533586.1 vacuolar sorting protein 9 (VPS9) domain family [Trichomonas vaginalis G3]|eukprot:XP_001329616.1 hypothetical protein [Trichomonas vaginalis G3]
MNASEFLIKAATRLMYQIDCAAIIDSQLIDVISKIPGLDQNEIDVIVMEHRAHQQFYIKLVDYVKVMKQMVKEVCPFKQAISIHMYALKSIDIPFFIEVIKEHQEALSQITGIPLPKNVTTSDQAVESVSKFFPFDAILPLMFDQSFFTDLMKIMFSFTPDNFQKTISQVFKLLKHVNLNPYVKMVVSEVILDYFVGDIKLSDQKTMFKNYILTDVQFFQNCKLIISGGISSLSINKEKSDLFNIDFQPNQDYYDPLEYTPPNTISLCFDDDGVEMPLKKLNHVWILLRKIPVSISTTSSFVIISKAIDWLKTAMVKEGMEVGADELFQFFVACIVNAKLLHLPTLIKMMDNFAVTDLMSARYKYLKTQLSSAVEFVQTRQIRVPPFLIFPFDKTEENKGLSRVDEGHIILPRFTVYAFPRFKNTVVSAVLVYTGSQADTAIGYKFKISEDATETMVKLGQEFMTIPTVDGTIFTWDIDEAQDRKMIKVNDGDMASHNGDVSIISNLLLMTPSLVKFPSIELKENLLSLFTDKWRVNLSDAESALVHFVTELQSALIRKGFKGVQANGVISEIDVGIIKSIITGFRNGEFYINQKIYTFILNNSIKQNNI